MSLYPSLDMFEELTRVVEQLILRVGALEQRLQVLEAPLDTPDPQPIDPANHVYIKLPYPHTVIEDIPEDEFGKWVSQYDFATQRVLHLKWLDGQRFLAKQRGLGKGLADSEP